MFSSRCGFTIITIIAGRIWVGQARARRDGAQKLGSFGRPALILQARKALPVRQDRPGMERARNRRCAPARTQADW